MDEEIDPLKLLKLLKLLSHPSIQAWQILQPLTQIFHRVIIYDVLPIHSMEI